MTYLVTGATGRTGSAVVDRLRERGARVRAYVRSREKGARLAARGVEVAVGTVEDTGTLRAALADVRGAYLMLPYDHGSSDFLADGRAVAEGFAAAVHDAGVPRTVGLSSVGAQHSSGTGAIAREHHFERAFAGHGGARFVRAGYFVENWGHVLPAATAEGVLPTFLDPDVAIPMVSSVDIGTWAADMLLDDDHDGGGRVVELAGPIDLSPGQVAQAVSALLGTPVRAVHQPVGTVADSFVRFGFSAHIGRLVQEMYAGYAAGHVAFEGAPARGRTSIVATLSGLLARATA